MPCLQEPRHVVALSGGKDSTALALFMRHKYPDLPVEYCFADTGRELPDLYRFLDDLSDALGVTIHRLTDYGRTFDDYLDKWGWFLPGNATRWCTKHLKIRPFERFVRDIAKPYGRPSKRPAVIYIGIRADEDREGNYGTPGVEYRYPLTEEGIDLDGVRSILRESGLQLPDFYKWRSTGGCWMCPWQRAKDWRGLQRNHPDLFEQAVREEAFASETTGRPVTWSASRRPLAEIINDPQLKLWPTDYDDDAENELIEDERPCLICAK